MEKSRKRAIRRDRSFRKWMRRLKADQVDHLGPWSPTYSYEGGVCTLVSYGDKTSLCQCFDRTSRQATRFKDTPNGCNCWGCANPRRTYDGRSREALTLQERKAFLGDQESWGVRKRRSGMRKVKVTCRRCGVMTGSIHVPYGRGKYSLLGAMEGRRVCKRCLKGDK